MVLRAPLHLPAAIKLLQKNKACHLVGECERGKTPEPGEFPFERGGEPNCPANDKVEFGGALDPEFLAELFAGDELSFGV